MLTVQGIGSCHAFLLDVVLKTQLELKTRDTSREEVAIGVGFSRENVSPNWLKRLDVYSRIQVCI
jgi:hypothetical protein